MNREIKFRAWQSQEKKMYIQGNTVDENRKVFWHTWENKSHISEPMQFTGLLDKNRNEIYEGDIVRCGYGFGKVIFSSGSFMVEWIDDKEANMELLSTRNNRNKRKGEDEFEIIGNVFQNLELLNP